MGVKLSRNEHRTNPFIFATSHLFDHDIWQSWSDYLAVNFQEKNITKTQIHWDLLYLFFVCIKNTNEYIE